MPVYLGKQSIAESILVDLERKSPAVVFEEYESKSSQYVQNYLMDVITAANQCWNEGSNIGFALLVYRQSESLVLLKARARQLVCILWIAVALSFDRLVLSAFRPVNQAAVLLLSSASAASLLISLLLNIVLYKEQISPVEDRLIFFNTDYFSRVASASEERKIHDQKLFTLYGIYVGSLLPMLAKSRVRSTKCSLALNLIGGALLTISYTAQAFPPESACATLAVPGVIFALHLAISAALSAKMLVKATASA